MNQHTFETYYNKYRKRVLTFFLNRGFSHEEAEELTQDVFFRVYYNRAQFRGETDIAFQAWLKTILSSVWKNKLRAEGTIKRHAVTVVLDEEMSSQYQEMEIDPEFDFLQREHFSHLRTAIEGLTEPTRICLIMRIYHQLKYEEIAMVMKLPLSTVKNLLHQARFTLRDMLKAL